MKKIFALTLALVLAGGLATGVAAENRKFYLANKPLEIEAVEPEEEEEGEEEELAPVSSEAAQEEGNANLNPGTGR